MKALRFSVASLLLIAASSAQAALPSTSPLVSPPQSFPSISLTSSPYLIYDYNGVDANTGLLRLVANASVLNEGAAAGGATQTQAYLATTDTTPDLMLSFQIRNGFGGFTAGSLAGGNVSISFGNLATAPSFSWTGNITNFGFNATGTQFDATWNLTADQYQNMPTTLSQFVNGYLAGATGGIKISNSSAITTQTFANDWVFGSAATTSTLINPFLTGLTTPLRVNSTVLADVYVSPVPEPETLLMLSLGLAAIAARSRKVNGAS
jgi:hypothetical protein